MKYYISGMPQHNGRFRIDDIELINSRNQQYVVHLHNGWDFLSDFTSRRGYNKFTNERGHELYGEIREVWLKLKCAEAATDDGQRARPAGSRFMSDDFHFYNYSTYWYEDEANKVSPAGVRWCRENGVTYRYARKFGVRIGVHLDSVDSVLLYKLKFK